MKFWILIGCLGLTGLAKSAEPNLSGATATLPYDELRALWIAARNVSAKEESDPAKAPVEAALHRADYTVDLESGHAVASFEIEAFTEGWHFIPLLGEEARPVEILPEESRVFWRDKKLGLLMDGAKRVSVQINLAMEKSEGDWVLPTATATASRLQVDSVPADMRVVLDGDAVPVQSGESVEVALRSAGGLRRLRLDDARYHQAALEMPSQWELRSQVLGQFEGSAIVHHARVLCHTEAGSGRELAFILPPDAVITKVTGEDLANWESRRAPQSREVEVRWTTPGIHHRELQLTYRRPHSPSEESWNLVAPKVSTESDPAPALFVIPGVAGLELTGEGIQARAEAGGNRIPLPDWILDALAGSDPVIAESVGELNLTATWLPTVEIAEATITNADYRMRLVGDGSLLLEVDYDLDHDAALAWDLALPADARILRCTLDGQPARPIARPDGGVVLDLPARKSKPSTDKDKNPATTRISLSYTAKLEELDPVSGDLRLELPATTLFIHNLNWNITLPDGYESTAIDWNAEIAPCPADGSILLRKLLCREETPKADIYYRRANLNP